MSNSLKVQLITRNFGRMLDELAAIDPRLEFRDVVVAEAVAVVNSAMSGTKAATVASIRRGWESKKFTTFNGKVYYLPNRYPDELWRRLWNSRIASLQTKLAARGLSKSSWHFLAQLLGGPSKAPGYVVASNYRGHQFPQNADRDERGSPGRDYTLQILNSSPIVQAAGGRDALIRAMLGRIRYFEINMERRAFRSVESRARKYPGIFVRPGITSGIAA